MLCGARVTVSYMRPGGVFADTPADFWPALNQFLKDFATELLFLVNFCVQKKFLHVVVIDELELESV